MKFALILVVLAGCTVYKPPVKQQIEDTRTYPQSYDEVWGKLVRWFALNEMPVEMMQKESGLIVSESGLDVGEEGDMCECGEAPQVGHGLRAEGQLRVLLEEEGDGTTVTVKLQCTGYRTSLGDDAEEMTCYPTGELATEILSYLE